MRYSLLLFVLLFTACQSHKEGLWIVSAPAGQAYTKVDTTGVTVLPNGRFIEPYGRTFRTAPHPFGLAMSQDGSVVVTANSGTSPLSITIMQYLNMDYPLMQQVPPGPSTDRGVLASVFMGLAVSPDNKTVYVSGGQENVVYMFDVESGGSAGFIDCKYQDDEVDYTHGYLGDMTMNRSGDRIFVLDQINFLLLVIDLNTNQVIHRIEVGRYPYGVCLSPDESKVYVANVGMFVYSRIASLNADSIPETSLEFPAFGYNTKEMIEGIHNDSVQIPGLGDPNVPESFSVWTIDINTDQPSVIAKIKTGNLVGELVEEIPAVGGSSPNSLVATDRFIFCSNGNNDNISVIDIQTDTIVKTIPLFLDNRLRSFRGIIPFGLAISPDQKWLYVAESGINAIGVIDIDHMKLAGHIPVGWFPSKLKVTPDGKQIIVANAKGYGCGPNGGPEFNPGPEGSYIGALMKGSVTVLDIPNKSKLKKLTQRVIENNFVFTKADDPSLKSRESNPVPLYPHASESPIKYLVFVSKENRTYDEIFGQIPKGRGAPSLARYGLNVSVRDKYTRGKLENVDVMVNHIALASHFGMSDNFYVDSDVSADGHRWLTNTYPNEWVESTVPASYGGNRSYRSGSKAPGVLGFTGAAGAIYPEDYNEAGSLWDHLQRNDIPYYNFGFSIMFEPGSYLQEYKYTGIRHLANYPLPGSLYDHTSRSYPTYNMAIPDQFRVDQFMKEYNEKWASNGSLPSLLTIIVPNDHGAGDRPEAGYPFRESYMADNDLAIGRLVEFLSHTSYWKEMAIVITEDDAQGGADHVDAHRSVLLVISPYVRRGYVSHDHVSFGSIFKTFWNILGTPYLNQYDAGAADLSDLFTNEPDFTPYTAIPSDTRIFDPQKALTPFDENFDWNALEESPEIDNIRDMMRESKEMESWRLDNRK